MNEKSFEKYFQNELTKVRNLAKEFSVEHPAVAPLLSADNADPDAERLLEGVAFLTGLLHQKLDDEFPEVIHGLINILFPHYLRPVPAMSIVEFYPKPSLREMIKVSKETIINSTPIDDVECHFSTTSDFNIYPIKLRESLYKLQERDRSSLTLDIALLSTNLSLLNLNELSFYIGDSYANSANLFMMFNHYLEDISLEVDNKKTIKIQPSALECEGFSSNNSLFSYPNNAFSGYRILQEYFVLPQKFLFLKLTQLEKLKHYSNAKSFKIIFHFKSSLINISSISSDAIRLFCTPVNNLFKTEAEPITLKYEKELIHVRPPLRYSNIYQVYDIKSVSSYIQGEAESKEYFPFESFQNGDRGQNTYQVYRKISIIDAKEELYIGMHYRDKNLIDREVLSIKISCTNGLAPERLQLGEISQSSDNSPELTTFKNIIPCTMQIDSPINENSLWQFISHLSVNLLTLGDIKTFKEMLQLYIFSHNRDKSKVAKNQKRIDAIEDFTIEQVDRVSRGYMLRGHKVTMKVRQDYFASIGDLYLFCTVILHFLSSYTTLNTFVELEVKEIITGESLVWAPILGNKKLI